MARSKLNCFVSMFLIICLSVSSLICCDKKEDGLTAGMGSCCDPMAPSDRLVVKTKKTHIKVGEDLPVELFYDSPDYSLRYGPNPIKVTAKIFFCTGRFETEYNWEVIKEIDDYTGSACRFDFQNPVHFVVPAEYFTKKEPYPRYGFSEYEGSIIWDMDIYVWRRSDEDYDGELEGGSSVMLLYRIEGDDVFLYAV